MRKTLSSLDLKILKLSCKINCKGHSFDKWIAENRKHSKLVDIFAKVLRIILMAILELGYIIRYI